MEVNCGLVGRYFTTNFFLSPQEIFKILERIYHSKKFELDDLGYHILLRGTETPVGFISDESAGLVFLVKNDKFYRRARSKLKRILGKTRGSSLSKSIENHSKSNYS